MQLVFATRAYIDDLNRFLNDLQAQYSDYEFMKDGKKTKGAVQWGLRPIQLYEIAFPEDDLDTVINTLWPTGEKDSYKQLDMPLKLARKILKLKEIPKAKTTRARPTCKLGKGDIRIIPIGYKEDAKDANGIELL